MYPLNGTALLISGYRFPTKVWGKLSTVWFWWAKEEYPRCMMASGLIIGVNGGILFDVRRRFNRAAEHDD